MNRSRTVNGPLLTLLVLVGVEALSRTAWYVPEPAALSLTAVVYSAATGGIRQGLISAALVLLHAAYAASSPYVPRQLFHMTDYHLRRFMIITLTAPLVAVMVGRLKERAESAIRDRVRNEE
jgi:hypothetical protein